MGWTKTQILRLCNQRSKRYELANCSSCTIAVQYRQCKFAQIPCKSYHGTIVYTNANYILARSCENGEDENANPLFVQSTHMQSGTSLQIVPPAPPPYNAVNGNSLKFPEALPRNNSCTNAKFILARSCGNGEDENANPPFVQSTLKAVRACKLFLLHHRRIVSSMEIRAIFQQTLPRYNSCTNANYILARSCGNGEDENANPPFVQSTHKAVRACKLFILHHRRTVSAM